MFLLASASPDENDNATEEMKRDNTRGVIKLRLISPGSFLSSVADKEAKKRASSVVCSLVCNRDLSGSGLTRNLTLNICVETEAVYIIASITGGFSAWCINADDFSSMLKGDAKTIPAFKCFSSLFLQLTAPHKHTGTIPSPLRLGTPIDVASCVQGIIIRLHSPLLLCPATRPS